MNDVDLIEPVVGSEIFNLTYLYINDYVVNIHSWSDFVFIFLQPFYHLEAFQNVYDIINSSSIDI